MSPAVDQITAPVAFHGESLIWDKCKSSFHWVDMMRGDVLTLDSRGDIERMHVGDVAAALRPRISGGLVVAVERGFAIVDSAGTIKILPQLWSDPGIRMNDGACDPQGRFYCGSMSYGEEPGHGVMYRLDPDQSTSIVMRDLAISNGLTWLAAGSEAVFVDSLTQRIDVMGFNADEGTFHSRRTLVTIDGTDGMPDGITLDVEDGVWVAMWGGSAVHRYTGDGVLDAVVTFPVRDVTSCALVDGYLYVSTSAKDDQDNPRAGALFRASVGVNGQDVREFAG